MEDMIRVMLVDDHALVRKGLYTLLERQPDMEIVGEAGNGMEAVTLARSICPDVILMDINMPVMNGLEATRLISTEMPGIWIVGLSINDDAETTEAMLEAGAACHLTKSCHSDSIVSVIRNHRKTK
jgi:DNA-binding NarL/FixJ family response regulator